MLTALIAHDEPATSRKLFGVVTGLVGTCLIVGVDAIGGPHRHVGAELAIVLATICYAGGAIFGKGFRYLDPMVPASGSLICGAAILVPVSFLVDRP